MDRRHTMREILFELEASARREMRSLSPAASWVGAHLHVTEYDFRAWLNANPDVGTPTYIEMIRTAGHYNGPTEAKRLQRLYAACLVSLPDDDVRPAIEALLQGRDALGGIDTAAMLTLIGWLERRHPNPKALMLQPAVIAKVNATIDLSTLPAPDFPHLHEVVAHGQCGT